MLPSSVRRVVSVPPTPLVSSLAASAPRAASGVPRRHQRRCSSSNHSSSDNGPKQISNQSASAVPASTSSRSGDSKSNGEKRKRKSKDACDRQAASQKLPSVPSTQHVSQEALGLSTFFSLHRPISVTHSMPKAVTEEAFSSIFNLAASGKSRNNVSDVMATLSRTADDLDSAMASMTISGQAEADANGDPVRKMDVKYSDGSESSAQVQLNAMAGQFVPFRPPPAPEAQGANENAAAGTRSSASQVDVAAAAEELLDERPQNRVYKALFTIEESTDADGQIQVLAHSPRIVNDQQKTPRSFLERLARRQILFDEAQGGNGGGTMQALSVKRQRKVKMKKKKYKKLMKRTRNLRRKLDRV